MLTLFRTELILKKKIELNFLNFKISKEVGCFRHFRDFFGTGNWYHLCSPHQGLAESLSAEIVTTDIFFENICQFNISLKELQ